MARIDCLDGTQRAFIERALQHSQNLGELASICGVHPRTFRDWRREKHRMPHESLLRLSRYTGFSLPPQIRILPEFWHIRRAAQLGGRRSGQLYGSPGSLESRRKGGRVSARRFQENPELAKALGFKIRKSIKQPARSSLLAEFIGIMLGDGCLSSRFQVEVAFNTKTDKKHGLYIQHVFQKLFHVSAPIRHRSEGYGGSIVASSRALVEYLQTVGLIAGNKVHHQVDVPSWILENQIYQRACLRGLMDTDGSVYWYTHRVYGHSYSHVALCFTNHSRPLLASVERMLLDYGFRPRRRPHAVFLHRQEDVKRYFQIIGTSNPKHRRRFQDRPKEVIRRGTQVADAAALEKR